MKPQRLFTLCVALMLSGGVGESSVVDGGGVTRRRRGAALGGIDSSLQQLKKKL